MGEVWVRVVNTGLLKARLEHGKRFEIATIDIALNGGQYFVILLERAVIGKGRMIRCKGIWSNEIKICR